MFNIGQRVLVKRSSGKWTPGTIQMKWEMASKGHKYDVILDQKGRRGQDIGKTVTEDYLRSYNGRG